MPVPASSLPLPSPSPRLTADGQPLARRQALQAALATLAALGGLGCPGRSAADLRDVVATVRRSVLPVGTYNATDNPRFGFRGSGFVVGDGSLVATNFHVLPEGSEAGSPARLAVWVAGTGGSSGDGSASVRLARLHASDRTHDLALLKIEGPPLPALPLAAGGSVREGQSVALMGFPIGNTFGFAPVTHRGIVASITRLALPAATAQQLDPRAVARLRAGNVDVLQLDATAYPGNSGGPVFDADSGAVVGVLNMVLVRGSRESALSQPTGISYAIPVQALADLLAGR